ncbi:glycosyltransferase, partial [Akkermansiaceae bacterium]|nr:glycosyltransferase [Akkermansiaceae bacterium]
IDVVRMRMAYSSEMDEVGRFSFRKIGHLFELIRDARRVLRQNPRTTLFYPPGSASFLPFIRDVIFLWAVRRHAAATVFIFHAGGLAAFVSQSRVRRYLAKLSYGKPDLALEVAHEEVQPREVFQARAWRWCPCATDVPEMIRTAPKEGKPLRILFVGSLQEGKGVLEIVKTAAWLKKKGEAYRFEFYIIGRWYSEAFAQETRNLINHEEVGDFVKLPGEVTGELKWKTYREADIFFFPSHYESEASPIVLMEAVGAGLPVVTTRWRGIPALLEGCESATVLPIKRPELYGQALLELEERRDELIDIAGKARAFYEERYQPHHFLGRIEDGLRRMWMGERGSFDPPRAVRRHSEGDTGLRVIQVFNQYTDQGGEEVWVDKMSALTTPECQIHNLRFQSLSWKTRAAPALWKQAQLMWNNPESRMRLRREVEELEPDALVFHNIFPVGSFGLYDEAARMNLPVIQFIHNFRPFSPSGTLWVKGEVRGDALRGHRLPEVLGGAWEGSMLKTGLMAFYQDRMEKRGGFKAVTHWVAVSEFMRQTFIEAGVHHSRISTLRHCWEITSNIDDRVDGDYYLFLGRLVPEKGINVLLDAWRILESTLGESCPKLIIAGTGPAEREVVARTKSSRSVDHVGFVSGDAKARFLRGCRAVIAPSVWWEPLGLIVYDAYEYGKPVLAARSGGLVETVSEGEGGLIHEPGNVEELASHVGELEAMNEVGRAKMGMTGRKWLEQNASPERWREDFEKLLKKVGVSGAANQQSDK